jgi:hypothetical protein
VLPALSEGLVSLAEEVAEKIPKADSLRTEVRLTEIESFCGTAEAMPFQNEPDREFFNNL